MVMYIVQIKNFIKYLSDLRLESDRRHFFAGLLIIFPIGTYDVNTDELRSEDIKTPNEAGRIRVMLNDHFPRLETEILTI